MKFKLLFIGLMLAYGIGYAQEDTIVKTTNSCGLEVTSVAIPALFEFESNAEANAVMNDIMKVVGLPANFRIQAADVPNAAAVVLGTTRYILYNPKFIKKVNKNTNTDWSSISILAHELGHHLSGHTLTSEGSRPGMELQADEFSGFVLRKMGASLKEAQAAMNLLASPFGSISHPPKANRLRSIAKGWSEADEQIKAYGGGPVVGGRDPVQQEVEPETNSNPGSRNDYPPRSRQEETGPITAPPIPDVKRHPSFASYKVDLFANKKSDYYITRSNEFVLVRGSSVRALGRLTRINDPNYTSMIKMSTNGLDLFIARGGHLFTERGNKVGLVKKIR